MTYLQIPDTVCKLLPRSATAFITTNRPAIETTFAQFVTESGNGLRSMKDATNPECHIRIAAARISKWLERLVLSGQDILVDAPHLTSRFPSLLKGTDQTPAAFDRTANFAPVNKLGIKHQVIVAHQFKKTDWLSRPCWYWPSVASLETIDEVRDPWTTKRTELVFCEDISRFKLKKDCHEFVADLPSQFARRSIAKLKDIDYRPEVRLSL